MEQFKVFRAIGLSFKAWFANFIPITLLAVVLYSPIFIWIFTMPTDPSKSSTLDAWILLLTRGTWLLVGLATLIPPLITYKIVMYMNGQKSSIMTSAVYGLRGIIPAVILAAITNLVNFIPFGGIISIIITCYWFVGSSAAVVEKLNPIAALSRSAALTQGRRGGIFGMLFLLGIIVIGLLFALVFPLIDKGASASTADLKRVAIYVMTTVCLFQLFSGVVQAVSYVLLRGDKDGVSNEELAKVFE